MPLLPFSGHKTRWPTIPLPSVFERPAEPDGPSSPAISHPYSLGHRAKPGGEASSVRRRTDSTSSTGTIRPHSAGKNKHVEARTAGSPDARGRPSTPKRLVGQATRSVDQGILENDIKLAFPTQGPEPEEVSVLDFNGLEISKRGHVKLGASHLDVSITFSAPPHFEMWDVQEDTSTTWSAQMNLAPRDPGRWADVHLSMPDISLLEITCCSKHILSCDSASDYTIEYSSREARSEATTSDNNIRFEPTWVRHKKPAKSNEGASGIEMTGWHTEMWFPIPNRLFTKSETKMFILEVRIWTKDGDMVSGQEEISVSHLRRERNMI